MRRMENSRGCKGKTSGRTFDSTGGGADITELDHRKSSQVQGEEIIILKCNTNSVKLLEYFTKKYQ